MTVPSLPKSWAMPTPALPVCTLPSWVIVPVPDRMFTVPSLSMTSVPLPASPTPMNPPVPPLAPDVPMFQMPPAVIVALPALSGRIADLRVVRLVQRRVVLDQKLRGAGRGGRRLIARLVVVADDHVAAGVVEIGRVARVVPGGGRAGQRQRAE